MKVFSTVLKVLVALAAVAGAIYVAATYGEQIVAWCKRVLNRNYAFNPCFEEGAEIDEFDDGIADEADFEG